MIPPSRATLQTLDMVAPGWCWSHLGAGGEGILSYESPRGRLSIAVSYTVADRQITIPLATFNETGWFAAGGDTRIEVCGRTPEDLRWVVRATGVAERTRSAEMLSREPSRWAHLVSAGPAECGDQLHLRTPRVRGFYETPLVA